MKFSGVSPNLLSESLTLPELQRMESWEDVPLEFSRLSIDSVKVSVALRRCDPFYPFLPSFVRFRILMDPSKTQYRVCEGSGDVVGVLTLLVGGVAQAFHDDRVVELRVQLGVQEVEGKDKEEQVEVEREKRVKEGAPMMMTMNECEKTQDLSQ